MSIIHSWVALSALGLLLSLYLARESLHDLHSLGLCFRSPVYRWGVRLPWYWQGTHNGRRVAAKARLARESLRISVHSVYLAIGIPILSREVDLTFVVLGLMWGNLALVISSLIDARTRFLIYATRDGETAIQAEDRQVGDTRRELQAKARERDP